MIGVWWAFTAMAWACDRPALTAELAETLENADRSFATMDAKGFLSNMVVANDELACLRTPLTPDLATQYHRLLALDAYFHKDELGTIQALTAMVAVDPDADLDKSVAPEGHPLRRHLETARTTDALPKAEGHRWWIDGSVADRYPMERPFVLQHEQDGEIQQSTHISAHAPLPDWTRVETIIVPPVIHTKVKKPFKKSSIPIFAAAGATALLAGGAYGYAWTQRDGYFEQSTNPEDRPGLRARANGATIAAGALGGVAIGLGSIGLVIAW